jgi:hypothetical protein
MPVARLNTLEKAEGIPIADGGGDNIQRLLRLGQQLLRTLHPQGT